MLVFDATALGGLYASHPPIWDLWQRANSGEISIGVPTCAIVEAGQDYEISPSQWASVLWPERVEVLPLSESAAVEIGSWQGLLHARHALWESMQLGWPVLTRNRELYAPGAKVLAV